MVFARLVKLIVRIILLIVNQQKILRIFPKNLQTIVLDENNFILSYTKLTDDRFGTIGAMKSGTVDQDNQMTFSNES